MADPDAFMAAVSQAIQGKPSHEAPDLTDKYNTKLTPDEEKTFQTWTKNNNRVNDTFDYDLRGAWKSNAESAQNGHLPDTWKKPNHPTFSDQSMYSNEGQQGGKWVQAGSNWDFQASKQNVENLGIDNLMNYFAKVEPGNRLVTPDIKLPYVTDGM